MGAISVDSQGYAAPEGRFSPKAVGTAIILAGALGFAGLGVYWLATAPPSVRNEASVAAAPASPAEAGRPAAAIARAAEAEAAAAGGAQLAAPAPTCVDGRPASDDVPADACL